MITFNVLAGSDISFSVSSGNTISFNVQPIAHSIPAGGSDGQVLAKASNTDYDVEWVDQTGGGGGSSTLDGLTDVTITSVASGNFLRYNGSQWVNTTISASDLPTVIDAAKIADGSVSNAEFQRLNGVTSDIQTQLDNKQPLSAVLTNTTASFTTADETKLDNITITQAVNLDTLETDSHTHSNKAVLDATTASFTTADETKLDGIEALADVTDAGNVGSAIHGATAKTTPVDGDTMPLIDSAASNVLKKVTWANIKATLKSYFDTLYQAAGSYLTAANIEDTSYNATSWDGVTDKAPSKNAVRDKINTMDTTISGKQDTLVSGTNIKTVNSTSLLGSGDVAVQATLVSGTNIKTINGSSVLGSGDLTIATGALHTPNKFQYKNDYLVIASDASFGGINFQNSSSGTGATISFENSAAGAQGVVRVQSGTTTTGRGNFWHPKGYNTIVLGDNGLKMWFKFRLGEAVPDATEDYVIRHGICQNVSGDGANDIVFIIGRGINSGKLSVRYRSNSVTRFDLDTTITPSTSWQECYLEMNASTHVITVYNTSGTLLATSSAPATKITNTELFGLSDNINKIAGTTNRTFYSDYFIFELT